MGDLGRPAISVVIPTYARPDRLRRCLTALCALDCPSPRFEVIVVDDGSPEPPVDLVAEFAQRLNIRLLQRPHAGPASARNAGATEATGEFLAFTDDDCAASPSWLSAMEACLRLAPNDLVAGRVVNALPQNIYSTTSQLLVDYLIGYFNADAATACFVTSNNMGIARAGFLEAGGFNIAFRRAAGEDREFGDRWRRAGKNVSFRADVVVEHAHDLTLRRFWRQHFNYGRGAWEFRVARISTGAVPAPLEPFSFYRKLVMYPFRQPGVGRRWRVAILLAMSQAANALGFLSARLGSRR